MTRLAVLADIHGNLPALEAIMADFAPFKPDQVIIAGDSVDCGPFSPQVLERIRREGWIVIRGNHEMYVLDFGTDRAPSAWNEYTLPPFIIQQLGPAWVDYLATLPDSLTLRFRDAPTVYIAHGSPRSHFDAIYVGSPEEKVTALLDGINSSLVIVGHTHLPFDRHFGSWRVINPGSAGLPLDGFYGVRYTILDGDERGWRATPRYVEYDRTPLFAEFDRIDFASRTGITGRLLIEEFRAARCRVVPFYHWKRDVCPDEPATVAMLEQFASVDPWPYTNAPFHVNK